MSKLDLKSGRIDMTHGSGGRAMADLIEQIFARYFANDILGESNDQARLTRPNGRLSFSTDSYVVNPLFFPGGNIGTLAVHGTINDIAMAGAKPLYLSAGFIMEEGFPLADLVTIVKTMADCAKEAGAQIVTGDTKVVEKGKADGLYINTSGIGVIQDGMDLSASNVRAGDAILLSGPIGDHGIAVMGAREGLSFDPPVETDSAALHDLIDAMIQSGARLRALRDPTRGGLGTTLNEIAQTAQLGMLIDEQAIPVREGVRGLCEVLGLDPLYVANEGRLIAFCDPADAPKLLASMRAHPKGADSAIIGYTQPDDHHFVEMKTALGGKRIVDWLTGQQLPRIC